MIPTVIPCQRHLFDIPEDIAYFNCAYMSPLMHKVVAAGEEAVKRKARPWQITPPDFFSTPEQARALFARLINARADDIAIIPSCSYGTATAALNLPVSKGQDLVVLQDQFPSNVYHWRELAAEREAQVVTIPRGGNDGWTPRILEAINADTAVVALPHCHWTDGSLIDLEAVGRRCREVGAGLVLDLTQSIGALPFDAAAVQPDFAVADGYKWMMGPYSCGMAYWSKRFLSGRPIEENWINRRDSENFARLVDYESEYQPGAIRFDVGEKSNFILLPMMEEALKMILEWSPERIQTYTGALLEPWIDPIQRLGFHISSPSLRGNHLFGLRLPEKLDPVEVKNTLDEHNVFVSVRGNAIRVAPHLYNTQADMTAMVDALKRSTRS